jgi:hypothetical protein
MVHIVDDVIAELIVVTILAVIGVVVRIFRHQITRVGICREFETAAKDSKMAMRSAKMVGLYRASMVPYARS